ncbi:hypothetical protein [Phaeobacter sp. HF9A]|uniref:COG3904 family protein n=1 Tax=Phaeobacter sp. HF9A TaxID=2721561 RepID=UPI001430F7FC|nr:hypothetical protein [Phaeobacter sp. HF9A]NIZ13606.1 hypothetical protein [Phaeobacter sp. HF9A]
MGAGIATAGLALDSGGERFFVEGATLVFDTENVGEDQPSEIVIEDIERLRALLQESPDVTELRLNSGGGSIYASSEIAWIVSDFGLDTQVDGECISACVDIFLAGARRRMTLGSKLGFHRRSWSPESVEGYYNDLREGRGWDTPFVFGSWIYEDTQREMYEYLNYLVQRGVDAGFAIETLRVDSGDEWYPSRLRLISAGVLREEAP